MEMGYTNLAICRKLELIKGNRLMVDKKYENAGQQESSRDNKFLVFQDPFTKLVEHGPHDVLFSTKDMETARAFAVDFTKKNDISTLLAQIKFDIYWH
jgi:hypothetical protein